MYDRCRGEIGLKNWEYIRGDLIIAADGVNLVARTILEESGRSSFENTGVAAYRATVDVERIKNDPEPSWLLDRPSLNLWLDSVDFLVRVGDQRHVMTYIIGAGKSFNMALSHPDHSDPSTWDQATALAD
ncbi:Monooxygenase FAD-binding [Penicillium canescens]|uniref:Monooxygenase FAD-binding n=1 Tax=Penicillium canescens TaxID=5083 RepID=A0AAD6I3U8_PENCN|nr:Monooxygenase FAD-binding [Penicillium canescens]KAJ6030199.1 Monooxygenase FAD-binding [Penicillium canescens]KAJ6063937.1 Monooxygenase FAD-binding [Penicillium canescens]KAJ6077804.1 Monooxygenase FAD-binding [Penicillium canescens]KAJ6154567.1 Monooxygenase FAD-binding [Penicillium canescens]